MLRMETIGCVGKGEGDLVQIAFISDMLLRPACWQTCSGSRLWCKEPIPFVLPTTSQSTLRTLSFSVFEHTVHCTTQPTFSWNGTRVSCQWRPKIISEQNFGHYGSMPTF